MDADPQSSPAASFVPSHHASIDRLIDSLTYSLTAEVERGLRGAVRVTPARGSAGLTGAALPGGGFPAHPNPGDSGHPGGEGQSLLLSLATAATSYERSLTINC